MARHTFHVVGGYVVQAGGLSAAAMQACAGGSGLPRVERLLRA